MIVKPSETAVAYRCPSCGLGVKSIVGIFSLSAAALKLKCPCGESSMTVRKTGDGKIRLQVPCLVCRRDHEYVVSRDLFFGGELFVLNCALSGLDLCYIGSAENVSAALEDSDRKLQALLKEAGAEDLDVFKNQPEEREEIPYAQVYDIVRFIVKELEAENAISCRCEKGDYDVQMFEDCVSVYCKSCGAKKLISTASLAEAQAFLEINALELE